MYGHKNDTKPAAGKHHDKSFGSCAFRQQLGMSTVMKAGDFHGHFVYGACDNCSNMLFESHIDGRSYIMHHRPAALNGRPAP